MRTGKRMVTFRHPFTLPGFDAAHPGGTFEVWTDEERLDTRFEGWLRVATTIRLVEAGKIVMWPVDPTALDRAIRLDVGTDTAAADRGR
jgi:hypothetical protein